MQGPQGPPRRLKKKLVKFKAFLKNLFLLYLWLLFVSSLAFFFEIIVFLIFEPLGVDFELSG